MKTITCSVTYGRGGLGLHLAQLVEDARAEDKLARYYAPEIKKGDEAVGRVVRENLSGRLSQIPPIRFSAGWKCFLSCELYDRAVASYMTECSDTYIGFVGQALQSFRKAKSLGCSRLELVAANSHVNNVSRLHAQAIKRYGIEDSWLNEAQCRKTLREYEMADIIQVGSEYTRQSFLAEGIAPSKLERTYLQTASSRFKPPVTWLDDGVFRVVYVGSLTVMKGIPVLLEAFSQLDDPRAELTLVGGWSSRNMRLYITDWLARDTRIKLAPGDPLPILQRANVYVHPTFEDGYATAAMEALTCGLPVIVTQDTGMKEYVQEGVNGYIVPTGNSEEILERLAHLRKNPLRPKLTSDVAQATRRYDMIP